MGFLSWLAKILGGGEQSRVEITLNLPPKEEAVPQMSSFDRAMEFVLRWEGGLVDHESDPGGLTNFGIAKRSHPDVDIKNLTEEQAKEIYRADYWDKIKGDQLPAAVAVAVMDYAVNSGVTRASRALQRVVHAGVDGQIGPNTISQVMAATANRSNQEVAQDVVMQRSDFLSGLVTKKPELTVFLKGWMRRTHSLMIEVS